jgi:hypothetical protein
VLASLGPIVAFFGASTSSYAFMKLLNVVIFAIAGALGLGFLLRTLNRLSGLPKVPATPHPTGAPQSVAELPASEAGPSPLIGPLDRAEGEALAKNVKTVFRVWIVLFGIVGGQMAWVLRPFLGAPRAPFMWFRPRSANFFHAVFESVLDLWR